MNLWLVRHARPDIAPGICYGRTDMNADADLTLECARSLAGVLPFNMPVTVSPLVRCRQLAAGLANLRPDLTFTVDARLQEMDFGTWEGQPWDRIARVEMDAWTSNFADYAVGHGESVSAFMRRVALVYDELPDPPPRTAPTNDALWITHAGVIRAASLIAAGRRQLQRADEWPGDAPGFGQWRVLKLREEVHNCVISAT
ncbi:MAG: phosphoglycerate kinase [Comamonadaceae bacterium]|nr:MAG: phosphoglycerate kinase [Comamonadaceae bacterium]